MVLDLQPNLNGELISLRPLRSGDFNDLYAVANDPLVWEQLPQADRYKRDVFEALFKESLQHGGALTVIENKRLYYGDGIPIEMH